jgi:uncharacterized protein YwgA
LNFPTKDHWRSVTRLDDIIQGLEYLLHRYKEWGITSLAVPPLGCGHGQLEWRIVGPTLYRYLKRMEIDVELYAPYGTPHEELHLEFLAKTPRNGNATMPKPQWVKSSWIALVEILGRIERQPYHWPVGHTIFQKIAYAATEEGLPTGLKYQRGSYGPFAPDIKNIMTKLANNGLIREERQGQMFVIKTGRTYKDARTAYEKDLAKWEGIIEKVADLFVRMDTRQAEMAATVLFSAASLRRDESQRPTEQDVLNEVMRWKRRRKPPLDERTVAKTIRNLAALGWLDVEGSEGLPIPEEEELYA